MNLKNLKEFIQSHFKKILYFFLGMQVVIFYILLFKCHLKTPLVQSDELIYLTNAKFLYSYFKMAFLHTSERPIFSWPVILMLKFFHLKFVYPLICSLNAIFYHIILISSIWWITKTLKIQNLVFLAVISTIYAIPLFFDMSYYFMGDVPVAAWIMLFTALLFSLKNPSHKVIKSTILGIITALGLQTKPIFIFYFGIIMASFLFIEGIKLFFPENKPDKSKIKNICIVVIFFVISFLFTLPIVLPKNIIILITELAYNNEKMGYWKSFDGLLNGIFWLPNVLLGDMYLLSLIILAIFFILAVKNILSSPSRLNKWKTLFLESKSSFLISGFIILILYVSFCVQAKGARVFFFIFPLFILLGGMAADLCLKNKHKICAPLILVLVLFNFTNTILWFQPEFIRNFFITNYYTNLSSANILPKRPGAFDDKGYNDYGLLDVLSFIDKNNQSQNSPAVIFVTNKAYNDPLLAAANFSSEMLFGIIPEIKHKITGRIAIAANSFQYGTFSEEGGVSRYFFSCKYIVLINNKLQGLFSGNTEIYNRLLTEKLSQKDPVFMDGLVSIYEKTNKFKDKIIIYERKNLPSPENYAKIMNYLAGKDPMNMWNVPFIYTALKIHPDFKNLEKQLDTMSEGNFISSVNYHYGTPNRENWVRSLLINRKSGFVFNISYPEVLQY